MTDLNDIEYPEDLDTQIEACLEAIRAQFVDPDAGHTAGNMVGIAMNGLQQLLQKVNPKSQEIAEVGLLLQGVTLELVVYYVSDLTPGDWFREATTDIKRCLQAIELLLRIADAEEAKAAGAAQ